MLVVKDALARAFASVSKLFNHCFEVLTRRSCGLNMFYDPCVLQHGH